MDRLNLERPLTERQIEILLGYSRRMMAAAATDQKLGTLLRMHELAFSQWGCVPD